MTEEESIRNILDRHGIHPERQSRIMAKLRKIAGDGPIVDWMWANVVRGMPEFKRKTP